MFSPIPFALIWRPVAIAAILATIATTQSDAAQSALQIAATSGAPQITATVSNAWNDTKDQVLYVHDTVTLQGGESDARLTPGNFTLTMTLAGGAKKTYSAMTTPAPSYTKTNALGVAAAGYGPTLQPMVDAQTDLGALGSIVVPAHGTASVTVTFAVDPKRWQTHEIIGRWDSQRVLLRRRQRARQERLLRTVLDPAQRQQCLSICAGDLPE